MHNLTWQAPVVLSKTFFRGMRSNSCPPVSLFRLLFLVFGESSCSFSRYGLLIRSLASSRLNSSCGLGSGTSPKELSPRLQFTSVVASRYVKIRFGHRFVAYTSSKAMVLDMMSTNRNGAEENISTGRTDQKSRRWNP